MSLLSLVMSLLSLIVSLSSPVVPTCPLLSLLIPTCHYLLPTFSYCTPGEPLLPSFLKLEADQWSNPVPNIYLIMNIPSVRADLS